MSRIADKARAANDLEVETVSVPQWGVDIEVRGFDGVHRGEFINAFAEAREADSERDVTEVELDLIILCSFDPEDNSQVFSQEDRDWLVTKSGAVIGRLSAAAMRVCGLDAKAEERVGKGSSSTTLTDASSSTSPTS